MSARLEWFAGLLDAEGCFHIRKHSTRAHNIVVTVTVGLVHRHAMDLVRALIAEIVGAVPNLDVRPPKNGPRSAQREFYAITVSGKDKVFALLTATAPLLRGKRLEARLALDVVARARRENHYRATELDFTAQRLSSEIKRGSGLARAEADVLLGGAPLPPASDAWLAGMLDGDGSVAMVKERKRGREYIRTTMVFGGADRAAVDDIRRVIGAESCTTVNTRPQRGGARAFHSFTLVPSQAVAFLRRVRPFMVVKSTEADLVVANHEGAIDEAAAYDLLRRIKTADYLVADADARRLLDTRL